jgi:hypothetical protein
MKVKLLATGLMVVATILVAISPSPRRVMAGQNANANKRAPRAKTGSATKASNSQGTAPAASGEQAKPTRPVRRRTRTAVVVIPSGAGACVARLDEWASKEPLPAYDKGPEQVINNGLLWNDPHSKCSVGSDQAVRTKVVAVATAWQQKDAGKVKEALAALKGSIPAETPTERKKPRRRRGAASSATTGTAPTEPSAANANSAKTGKKGKSGKSKTANKNSSD